MNEWGIIFQMTNVNIEQISYSISLILYTIFRRRYSHFFTRRVRCVFWVWALENKAEKLAQVASCLFRV